MRYAGGVEGTELLHSTADILADPDGAGGDEGDECLEGDDDASGDPFLNDSPHADDEDDLDALLRKVNA